MAASDHLSGPQFGVYISPQRMRAVGRAIYSRPEDHTAFTRLMAGTHVPVEHLHGIQEWVNNDSGTIQRGAGAEYESGDFGEGRISAGYDVNTANSKGMRGYLRDALTHEVGHHQHWVSRPAANLAGRGGGRNEAVADNYAEHHMASPTYPRVLDTKSPEWRQQYVMTRAMDELP